jgi:hypothetical protein
MGNDPVRSCNCSRYEQEIRSLLDKIKVLERKLIKLSNKAEKF